MVKKQENLMPIIGAWLFVIGLLISLVAGWLFPGQMWVPLALGIIGIVVGLVNITEGEVQAFLIAAIAFNVAIASLVNVAQGLDPGIAVYVVSVFTYAGAFVAPAAAVVAIKAIYELAKSA